MKKLITAILILCTAVSLFAAASEPVLDYSDKVDFAFNPTLGRYNSMGQSGLAAAGRVDAMFTNPAALGQKRFGLQVPSASVTLYNIQRLVSDSDAMVNFNTLVSGQADDDEKEESAINLLTAMVGNLGSGYNTVATVDTSLALEMGNVGFGGHVQLKLHSWSDGNSNVASVNIIPELNAAQTIAFGVNIIDSDKFTLAVGVSGHAVVKAYFKAQGANTLISALNNDDDDNALMKTFMWKTPVMAGYALPVDAGLTAGLANNTVRFSVTANNMNGTYSMKSYSNLGTLANTIKKGAYEKPDDVEEANESVNFKIQTPMELNFGFAWAPKIAVIEPVITADLVDMLDMIKGFSSGNFKASDLLLHLNAGAELTVLKVLNLRAGVNRGYMSVGAGIGLIGLRVEASYGWQEFGNNLGDKPVDSLTIRVNLGVDR